MRDRSPKNSLFKGIVLLCLLVTSTTKATTYYSRANTNWTVASTWSTVSCGGTAAVSAPTASDDVIICAGYTVNINAAGTCKSLTIQGTANWTSTATLAVGTGGLDIQSGGDITGTTNGTVSTTGGFTINATLTSANVTIRTATTAGQTISGTGSLAKLDISAATTNNATLTVRTSIASTVASTLTQGSTASLTYAGTTITPTLDASASGNTVTYSGTTQTVKLSTYHHLIISGSGAKTLGGAITVNGDFSINAGTLATNIYQITGNTTGTFSMAASTGLYVGLNSSSTNVLFPTNFTTAHTSLSSTSTVYYYGNSSQTISSVPTYGNLNVVIFSGAKTADGNLTVMGNLTTTTSTLTMTTYDLNLTGNYVGAGALSFTTGTFNIGGSFTNTGTFTKGTGSVNYNGSSAQTVRGVNYNNLTFSGTGDKLLQASATVGIGGTFTRGTMTVTPGASSTVAFNGSAQTMTGSATSFVNLTISATTSLSAPNNFTVSGNLTTTAGGTLTMSSNTLNVTGNYVGGGTLSFTSGTFNLTGNYTGAGALSFTTGTFNIAGSYTNSGTFTCGTGTVEYNGSGAQTVRGVNYNNLIFSNTGAKTLQASATVGIAGTFTRGMMTVTPGTNNTVLFNGGAQTMTGAATSFRNLTFVNTSLTAPADFTVAGTLTTTSPATLNMTNNTLSVTGNYAGTGALTFTSGVLNLTAAFSNTGTFTCGTGTVNYIGASQTIRGVNYYNLSLSGSGTKTLQAASTIGIAGTFTRGTVTVTAGATNTVLFNGGAQVMTGNATTFVNLTINNTSLTIPADITVGTTLTFTAGNIITGSSNVILTGSIARTSGHVVGNLRKRVGTGTNVSRTFEIGTASTYNPLTLLFASVTTGGTFTASTTAGDHPSVASSGFNTSKTVNRYWTIANATTVYTNYALTATFVSGDLDVGYNTANSLIKLYNGSTWALTNAGTATSTSMQALAVATPTTPNTVYAQIGEIIPSSTGNLYAIASTAWSTAGTWSSTSGGASCGCIPTSLDNVYIENNFTVIMDGNSGAAKSLTIQTGGKANWTSALTTNIGSGGINIASTGDITGTVNGILTTSGGLTLNKVLTSTAVTIKTQTTDGQTISGTGTVAKLDISAYTTNSGNITVSTSILSSVASTLTLGASSTLTYNGTAAITTTLDGSVSGSTFIYGGAAQTVKSGTYHHLIVSGSGTKTLGGAITLNGNLSINVGTLSTSTYQITGNATGTFTMAASTTLNLGLAASATNVSFPTGFTTGNTTLASTSTVVYLANYTQTVSSTPTYGNLTIQTVNGSKTANGALTVAGILRTTSPSTLSMAGNNLTLTGAYAGTGALSFTSGAFNIGGSFTNTGTYTCGTGTVTYNGAAQTVRGVNYYNLTLAGSGTKTLQAASTVGIAGTFTRGTVTVAAGATNTVLFNGGVQTMTGNATTFVNLTINNTSITIPADITVGTTLTFTAGNIITGSSNVILPSTGSVSRTSGHVIGNLRKNVAIGTNISRTFEVGTNTDYAPLSLAFASVSVTGNFTVSTTGTDHGSVLTSGFNPNYTVNRFWTVTNATTVYTNYTATATFVNGDKDPGYTPANSVIKIYNGSTWSSPTAGTPTSNTAVAQSITTPTTPNTIYLQIGDSNPNIAGNLYSIASGNWSSSGTWSQTSGGTTCYCIPTSVNEVVIENDKTVTMDGNPGVAKSLTVQTGGIATWTSALTTNIGTSGVNIVSTGDITGSSAGILTTAGGLTLNKTLTSTSVIIKTITTAGQTIAGTGTLANLDINVNTTNNGNISLTDVLTITAGTLTNAGTFTLVSTASKTARIAPIACMSCGFSGNFVIQNYIPGRSVSAWANMSSPVSNTTMADWDHELFMEYPFTGFDYVTYRPTGTNVLAYDEPSANYVECTSATALTAGKGFEIGLVNDNNSTTFSATTLTTIGTPNTGTFNLPLSYTSANGPAYPTGYTGENLMGNPYASAITVNGISFTNALTYVDVYDYATNNYKSLSGTDIIGPHQGFWVYAQGNGGSIQMTESSKSTNSNTPLYKSANAKVSYMGLTLSSADGSHTMAHTLHLASNTASSDGWDENDRRFRKSLTVLAPNLTASIDNVPLSYSSFSGNHETYVMPLTMHIGINGQYQINATGLKYVAEDYREILLVDKLTHKIVDLTATPNYVFMGRTTDATDRFELHFSKSVGYKPQMSVIGNDLSSQVEIAKTTTGNIINFNMAETETMNISVMDLLGRSLDVDIAVEANNQSVEVNLPSDFHGTYLIIIQSSSGNIVKKFIQL